MSLEELDTSTNHVVDLKFQEALEHHAGFRYDVPHERSKRSSSSRTLSPLTCIRFSLIQSLGFVLRGRYLALEEIAQTYAYFRCIEAEYASPNDV